MTTTREAETFNGVVTSWIALTTPGPVASSACSSAMYFPAGSGGSYLEAFNPAYESVIDQSLECFAKEQVEWWLQSDLASTTYQLGPFACPSMYTTATTEAINAQTTLVACCPSGYTFQNTIINVPSANQCLSYLPAGQIVSQEAQIDAQHYTPTTTTIGPSGLPVHGAHVNGYVFATATGYNSSADPTAAASSSVFVWEPSDIPSPTATSSSSGLTGLTTGTKVGIGLGIGLIFVGFCSFMGAIFVVKRRAARTLRRLEACRDEQLWPYPEPKDASQGSMAGKH